MNAEPGFRNQFIVARIAGLADEIARLAHGVRPADDDAMNGVFGFGGADSQPVEGIQPPRPVRSPPIFPHPHLIRRILRMREMRAKCFPGELFADPAWDMLLDLAVAHAEQRHVSVSSVCIASRVAPTTALRWIARLIAAGLLERRDDPVDRRRAFVALSPIAAAAMARYFDAMDGEVLAVI